MPPHWSHIFSAGVVWDPSEPLPPELQHHQEALPFTPGHPTTPTHLNLHTVAAHHSTPAAQPKHLQAALPTFARQEHGRNVLPPLAVAVDASIVQDTARVAVTQHFHNDSIAPIKEAAFTFPLPAGCTITGFSCRIGTNKIIKGTVKPRQEARDAFEHHIRQQATAAGLLEQDTPEVFTTTLGNIPEKTRVQVNLNYITLLKHRFVDRKNVATLTIPTSIAPRYGEAPEDYNDAATSGVPQGLTLEAEIVESERIASITSPSHAVLVERRRGARVAESFADLAGEDDRSQVETALLKLESGRMFLDRDFVLDIVTAPNGDAETPQAWLEEHPTLPNHKALMLTLPPGFLNKRPPERLRSEILFLADLSGSMKKKIPGLKSAMQFFLKGIPEGRKFNIWCFGSNYTSWQPCSVDYGEATLGSALSWVETTFAANMGGTELLPAIQAIVSARDKALMTDVIVLTDGQTWRLDQTLEYINKTRANTEGRVRFFALGIGKAVSHALVDGIAKAGGGYAEVVQEASQGGWEDRVVSMAKAALMSAHLGPLHMEFKVHDKDGNTKNSSLPEAQRSPADVSAVSPFERSRIYFLLDNNIWPSERVKQVRIDVPADGDTKSFVVPVTVVEKPGETIHKLAARSMLDDLERGRSHIHLGPNRPYPGSWEETNAVRKEAEKIASKWGLLSKWTSFLLVEEQRTTTEEDQPTDGIIEVKNAPGDDLLQPRGTAADGSAAGLIGRLYHPAAPATPPPNHSFASRWLHALPSPPPAHSSLQSVNVSHQRCAPPAAPASGFSASASDRSPSLKWAERSRQDRPECHGATTVVLPRENATSMSPEPGTDKLRQRLRSRSSEEGLRTTRSYIVPDPEPTRNLAEAEDLADDALRQKREDPFYGELGGGLDPILRLLRPSPFRSEPRRADETERLIRAEKEADGDGGNSATRSDAPLPAELPSRPSPPPVPSKSQPTPEQPNNNNHHPPQTETDFITTVLQHQQYDGSINFPSWRTAESCLGSAVCGALSALRRDHHHQPGALAHRTLWTAAALVLLERDFAPRKPLWELMALKMASYCARHPLPGGGDVLPLVRERLRGVGLPRRCEDSRGGGGDGKAVGPEVVAVGVGPAAGGAEAGQDLGGSAGSDMVVVSREDANDDAADGGGAKEPEEGKEQQQAAPQKKGFPWSLVPTKRIGRRVRMAARQHPPRRPPEIGPRPVVLFPMDAGADPFPEPVVVADPLVKPTKSAERRRFSVHF